MDECQVAIDLCVQLERRPQFIAGVDYIQPFESYAGVYGMVCHRRDTTFILFQGSDGAKDWILDIAALPVTYSICKSEKAKNLLPWNWFRSRRRVHGGFREGYYSIRGTLRKLARDIDDTRVVVAGHSYGAALATFAALDMRKWLDDRHDLAVYLFASPRVGNAAFKEYFNQKIDDCINIAYQPDPVPHLPPSCLGYEHVGKVVFSAPQQHTHGGVFGIAGSVDKYIAAHNIYRYQQLIRGCEHIYCLRSEPLV